MLVLFDLDDTLVDHSTAFQAGTRALYNSLDSPVPFEYFAQAWASSHRRQYDRYLAGELSYDGQRLARVREVIDPALSDQEADRVFTAYLDAYEAGWSLFPDVLACLDGLSDCQMGIVTNGQGHQQRSKLERTGIRDRFDCIVTSEEYGRPKPQPEIFWHACSSVGQQPGRAVFVGDVYELDAIAARRAGLVGVWLNRAVSVDVGHAPPIIHSLTELAAVVRDVQQTG
jgi:putative hydrolase of the HAD superfamily